MENIRTDQNLEQLTEDHLKSVSGGQPSKDTGFWYDVAYLATFGILVNPSPTSWAVSMRLF